MVERSYPVIAQVSSLEGDITSSTSLNYGYGEALVHNKHRIDNIFNNLVRESLQNQCIFAPIRAAVLINTKDVNNQYLQKLGDAFVKSSTHPGRQAIIGYMYGLIEEGVIKIGKSICSPCDYKFFNRKYGVLLAYLDAYLHKKEDCINYPEVTNKRCVYGPLGHPEQSRYLYVCGTTIGEQFKRFMERCDVYFKPYFDEVKENATR